MAKVTPQEYAEKWGRRLKGSVEDVRRGINRVTEAPGIAAARSKELMKARIIEAIDNGTWEEQVGKVTLAEWKDAALNKGVNRIAAGVDGAQTKQQRMAANLLAAVDEEAAKVKAMPKGTIEDSINRMNSFARGMHGRKIRA